MDKGTKFIGFPSTADMTERKSAQINTGQEVVTIEQIRGDWKVYKALLTQSGSNNVVARVLNEDEVDYLGEIVWTGGASPIGTLAGVFPDTLTAFIVGSPTIGIVRTSNDVVTLSAGTFTEMYLEIRVRERGTAPVLLDAHTDEGGSMVILTFDKEMSDYGLSGLLNQYPVYGGEEDIEPTAVVKCSNPKTLQIEFGQQIFFYGEVLTFSYDPANPIESIDRGLLGAITDFPVANYTPDI